MARCHVRCRQCATRRVLRMAPDQYIRMPKCNVCGAQNYRKDKWMNNRPTRKHACWECAGYWFPHRMGSLYCVYRKDGTVRAIGDPDFADRNYLPLKDAA
jgi:hypothetical protein